MLIVVVGSVKSTLASTGVIASIQETADVFVGITVPYPVPAELANSIVTYVFILYPDAPFK